jgi:hypothetical protein
MCNDYEQHVTWGEYCQMMQSRDDLAVMLIGITTDGERSHHAGNQGQRMGGTPAKGREVSVAQPKTPPKQDQKGMAK